MTKLEKIALSYVGTPHHNGGNVKGAGLDCCTLVAHVYRDMGWGDIPITFGYSSDWFCKKGCEEILLAYLEMFFKRVKKPKAGDVASYRFGRAEYAHVGIVLPGSRILHCTVEQGVTVDKDDAPYFFDRKGGRITGYWRRK